jgi:phage gp29-like protein
MAFFGLFGSPKPEPVKTEPPLTKPETGREQAGPIVASFARNPYGGHPAAGLTPAALAIILRSSIDGSPLRYLELAEDMEERFWQYGSTLSTRKRAVSRLEIRVKPAGDEQADLDEAELVREVVHGAAFKAVFIDMLDAIGKSYSAVEIIWDTDTKPWKPMAFKYRDPRFFEFDRHDPEKLMLLNDHGVEELWPNCWIVHRAKAKSGLTIRGGLARQVAWLYIFQSFNIKDWAAFAEAYGMPMRVGKFDQGASETDKAVLLEAVHSIASDFAAIIPESMAIEFIKAEITGSTDLYERRADWLDRQCSKVVLGQTGTTDSSEGSGYAQAKVHDGVRDDIADADGEQVAATLNGQLVPPLIDFNFPRRDRRGYPEIIIGQPDDEDIGAMIDNVQKLVPLGLEVSMAEIQAKIGITPPKDGEKLLVAPRARPVVKDDDGASEDEQQQRVPSAQQLAGDAIQAAVEEMIGEAGWEPLLAPLATDVRNRLLAAETPEDARRALAEAMAGLDVDAFADLLAKSMFAARLAGELDEGL